MGEAVLGAFLPVLLEKLADREVTEYFRRLKGVDKKLLEKWTRTLTAIEAVLSDAEEKQLTQRAVKEWLDDLKDLAYDVQDILDIFDTKMLKRRIERQHGSKSKLWSPLSKAKSNFTLNSAIKKINDRFEEITTREKQFGLQKLGVSKKPWKMPPTTSQLDGPVIGRDEEKAKILERLLSKHENYHVVGIVGTGGLGKTTLAKHVFNNAATDQFSPKGWVSVSDDFDIVRVAAAILESVTSSHVHEFKELNSILEKLSKELASKKFLIVLDDVWHTCSYDQWITLQSSFCVGAAGSKIIVTTRDADVAKMMGDNSPYELKLISEDDCWEIFKHHALLNNRPDEDVEFLKKKIVEKCNGLPLAARTLGGLLRRKDVDEWEDILDHKMWTLSHQNKMDILPALKLSYHYLPSTLKRCFSYCAILPNDYEFEEMQLIMWWMAEGLIPHQHEEHKQMEDLGREYFQELVSRSLFQRSSKEKSRYIMHDLVTDLARWASGSSCSRLEDMQNSDSPKVRHSSYILGEYDGVKKFEVYSEATCLRTFLPLQQVAYDYYDHYLAHKVTSDLLPKLQYLRLLSLKRYQITKLPDTISELKHLRYLDLSCTEIEGLPDSTTTLYNLQTLILKTCRRLKALPTSMRNLVNLRHLDNSHTSLEEMPPQLGQLTNLQTLPEFVIGKGSGSGVGEIGSLSHLQGTLHISRLENVICVEDAKSADLKSKERLEALFLEWSSSSVSTEDASIVLDMAQPHSKLKELSIKGYAGLEFSTWIGNPSFTKMVRVRLVGCNHCQFLPPLGQLPCLKELYIQEMDAVESVGVEFYGEGPFHVLETLEFGRLKNWKKWSHSQQNEGVGVFSCLKRLSISGCPKLEGDLPEKLDSLSELEISGCEELVVSVSNYKQLHKSNIKNCKTVVYDTSAVQFGLLEILTFSNIPELRFQTEAFMKSLRNVKELEITGCEELTCSFQNEHRLLQHLISLGRLYIEDNSTLVERLGKEAEQMVQLQILDCKIEFLVLHNCGKVPEGLNHLTSLRELHMTRCSSLVSFPDVGLPPCLQVIEIGYCNSLLHFTKYRIPPSLKRIEIWDCEKLKSLIEKEEVGDDSCCLERLMILNCPSLMCLLRKGQLPRSLKELIIRDCGQLELITERSLDDTCQLESIEICDCRNLKSVPEGLCHLTNLQSLYIRTCQSLVSLPRMNVWPRVIRIINCEKLDSAQLARDMMHATNIEILAIDYCEGLTISFPSNLTSLRIWKIKNCKALMESQVLQRLASLRDLMLCGEVDGGMVSFPPAESSKEMEKLLPRSLVCLTIVGFSNLKKLSKGFQFFTSLESLQIHYCPKLTTLPVEKGLPLSLTRLDIHDGCPLLEDRIKGIYRPKIAHIPCVTIKGEVV